MTFEETISNELSGGSFSILDGEDKLVARAVKGESSAFGFLYDHYQPKIYRFVFIKVGGQREEAEDLTHQVFLNAWQNIGGYRNMGFPFSSWLYRIARNHVIDFYRTKKNNAALDEIDPDVFASQPTIELSADHQIEMKRVMRAMRELKSEHQDVIIMRFIEELSIKEVAAAMKKTEGSVKLMQHRALKQLRGIIA